MSVNVYLNEKVRELPGFNCEQLRDDKGRLYLVWSDDAPIPGELKDLVAEISCHDSFPQLGRREAGIYRHKTAECELVPENWTTAMVYKIKVVGRNLEDIRAIVRFVKIGHKSDGSSFRPEESYEGPQSGKSCQQLEDELATTQQRLEAAQAVIEDRKEEADTCAKELGAKLLNTRLSFFQLAANLETPTKWRAVRAWKLAEEIRMILDSHK